MPSCLAGGTRGLNKIFWNLRSFCHHRDYLLVYEVQWLFTETTGLPEALGELSFGEHKDFFPSFGLSQHSEGCPTLGAHQVLFHPLGLELRTDLQVLSKLVMYGCWEIQIASSAEASKVMSHYRMRSQHCVLTLYVSCILYAWGRAKAWVHWRNGEVLLLNPLATKSSTRFNMAADLT